MTAQAVAPPGWPQGIQYLKRSQLSALFPVQLIPLISSGRTKFQPQPVDHPSHLAVKRVNEVGHPAFGQYGLFAKKRIVRQTMIVPYLGVIHASFTPADNDDTPPASNAMQDDREDSDYDLSLLRPSASDPMNPFPGQHISIGVDAATSGNAGRMVNDYRGVAARPNAEFRLGAGQAGELQMELWALGYGLNKGEEVLVNYGKGFWNARTGAGA